MKLFCMMLAVLISAATGQSIVLGGGVVEKIADGFQFVEGPVWKDGLGLRFSDIPGNTVYRWTPDSGVSVFLKPSSNSNGLALDSRGRLVLCQTGSRRVARLEDDGTQTVLAVTYDGKKLNSPNDLAVKSDGAVFFTDPPFNIPVGQSQELSFSGIYRISPTGTLQLLDSSLALPNGICFSPDESKIYVNNSMERSIYVWDIVNDSTLANKRQFASIKPVGYADGMKVDAEGNLFCCAPLGVWVFGPTGTVLDTILVPGQTANCGWGDADRKTLYITSGNSIYKTRWTKTGVGGHGSVPGGSFRLFTNYPNPFNPTTTISFLLPQNLSVSLRVYDVLGQNVVTLLDREMLAGVHSLAWNAQDVPSGLYLCEITAGGFCTVNKMMLAK